MLIGSEPAWIAGGSSTPRSLQVISNKSCYGHTEGAAGLTGVLLALCASSKIGVPPVMHLRSWNPHVAAALDTWRSQSKLTAAVPTQAAGDNLLLVCIIKFPDSRLPSPRFATEQSANCMSTFWNCQGIHTGSTPIATHIGTFFASLGPSWSLLYPVNL